MRPFITTPDATVWNTDARNLATLLDDKTVDAVVTDPPYELRFNGAGANARYDDTGVAFDPTFWTILLDKVKPGGFLMAFGAPRTWHRLAVAVEDAGWLIRDQVCWLYASGMPKGEWADHAVDRALGVQDPRAVSKVDSVYHRRVARDGAYEPQTLEARRWIGWNPTLKPAWEPILVAQRPRETKLGDNLLEYGTGALHVGTGDYPSNVVADGVPELERFHLTGKAPQSERPRLEDMAVQPGARDTAWRETCDRLGLDPDAHAYPSGVFDDAARPLLDPIGPVTLEHPTVKPVALIRRLVHWACPPGGLVLDPFLGSGTTLDAARMEGARLAGCEIDPMHLPLIRMRSERPVTPPLF